ncbi:MAG: alanine--tRNA ligase-related protein, partial [Candidatus Thermoplasmatota archaeon]|nr:alanine--tRNA ligase-related protein [Candidatus Thermoplasmatota archaeon]
QEEFPSLATQQRQIHQMIQMETRRYHETLTKGKNMVKRLLTEKQVIDDTMLITLYDTHGMPPDIVQSIARQHNVSITIPSNFESMVAELHSKEEEQEQTTIEKRRFPDTKLLFYDDHYLQEFDAKVLWAEKSDGKTLAVFDQTAFYPEGGGQPGDYGWIRTSSGQQLPVENTTKQDNGIIHHINGSVSTGDIIHGEINWDQRYQLMKHHTGTHVVNGALQKILGDHIWQAGSQLGIKNARFDYAHFKSLSDTEMQEVEQQANQFISENIPVEKQTFERNTAEKKYGFRLYQGGVPPGNTIRVLHIPGVDVEACGGTHLNNTGEIEKIRLLKSERIQDGVNRLIFAAGDMVDEYNKEEQRSYETLLSLFQPHYHITLHENTSEQLNHLSTLFSVPIEQLPRTIKRFLKESLSHLPKNMECLTLSRAADHLFETWKKTKKEKKTISEEQIKQLLMNATLIPGTNIKLLTVKTTTESNVTAGALIEQDTLVVHVYDGNKITSAASPDIAIDLREEIAPAIGKILGGSGGGRQKMTQSGGPNKEHVDEALEKAKELTIRALKQQ